MKKINLKTKLIFILLILSSILLISNISNASEEIFTYENLNYYINTDEGSCEQSCVIDSLVDYSIEELRIPKSINGIKVSGFKHPVYPEDTVADHILTKANNLKKLILEDASFSFGVYLNQTDVVKNSSIKEVVIEQKNFSLQYSYEQLFYFNTSVKFYGYGHTKFQDELERKGYTYESIGENDNVFIYGQSYNSEDGTYYEDKSNVVYINAYVENLIVPKEVKRLEMIRRYDYNATHSVDQFTVDATAGIKTITFESKDAFKVIDQGYFESLETVYGYEGTGADNFAANVGAEFISLGKTDTEINQFSYEIIDNNYVAITGLNKTSLYKLEIPEYIEGLPVKIIKADAIPSNSWGKLAEVNDIVIPSTVEIVEKEAFIGCNLKTITVYSKNIEFLNKFEFFSFGYTISYSPIVYAYDESGMKELVKEENYISLNKVEILKDEVTTDEVEVNGEKVVILPTDAKTNIENLKKDKFVDNNYDIEIKDINGNTILSGLIGSKSVITIKDGENIIAEFTVVVSGDVTGNGNARMYDAFLILKESISNKEIDAIDVKIRDFNKDGNVRMYDAFQFLKASILH